MSDVTHSEWFAEAERVASEVAPHRLLTVEHHRGDITIYSAHRDIHCGATITLRGSAPSVAHCSPSLNANCSTLTESRFRLTVATAVIEVAEEIMAQLGGLRAWPDGECPCGSCGAKGETRGGVTCSRCEGRGKR